MTSIISDLILEMQQFGFLINYSNINTNGKIQRVATQTKPKSKNGWYVVHVTNQGIVAIFGDHQKNCKPIKWTNITKASQNQYVALKNKIIQTKIENALEKKFLLEKINLFYSNEVRPMILLHKYLDQKNLTELDFNNFNDPLGVTNDNKLVIPIRNISGELMGLQTIDVDGKKLMLKGSQKKGNFYTISNKGINLKNAEIIFIGEGFSTMASIHIAAHKISNEIRICSIMAIDVYNIEIVLNNIVKHNSIPRIVLVADNDCASEINIGVQTCTFIFNKYKHMINLDIYIPQIS